MERIDCAVDCAGCGDGICQDNENCSTCEVDCGSCLKTLGEVCSSGSECESGYCYVDEDGDRYAPESGTKK